MKPNLPIRIYRGMKDVSPKRIAVSLVIAARHAALSEGQAKEFFETFLRELRPSKQEGGLIRAELVKLWLTNLSSIKLALI